MEHGEPISNITYEDSDARDDQIFFSLDVSDKQYQVESIATLKTANKNYTELL